MPTQSEKNRIMYGWACAGLLCTPTGEGDFVFFSQEMKEIKRVDTWARAQVFSDGYFLGRDSYRDEMVEENIAK